MKKNAFFIVTVTLLSLPLIFVNYSCNKDSVNKIINALGLSKEEIAEGLTVALDTAARDASHLGNKVNGFLKNELIRLALPEDLQPVMKLVDLTKKNPITAYLAKPLEATVQSFVTSLNRSAEAAAGKAFPIFSSAIKSMTITDALGILQGSDSAATHYLRSKTTLPLTEAFSPVCKEMIAKCGVTNEYENLANKYNEVLGNPVVAAAAAVLDLPKKLNTDLPKYVTGKALDGMYILMRGEEKKIRDNPQQYASDIIQKVFGSKEAKEKKQNQ